MKLTFNDKPYETCLWKPAVGKISDQLAYDSETELITLGQVPGFVIGQVYSGGSTIYFLRLQDLQAFFEIHAECTIIMHNAPFDISVVENETTFRFDSLIQKGLIIDTGLLYRLCSLAEDGRIDKWNLGHLAKKLLGVILDKDSDARKSFGKFRLGSGVNYSAIPLEYLHYAAIDPVATFEIKNLLFQKLQALNAQNLLSHNIQLKGAVALDKVSRLGIGFDQKRKDHFITQVDSLIEKNLEDLRDWGYVPRTKGVVKSYESIVKKLGLSLPQTESGRVSQKKDHLEEYRGTNTFVDAFLSYSENKKLKDVVVNLKSDRIHTRFNSLLNTGRTSSSEPNIQNLPRKSDIRPCFSPASGYCFLQIDYSQLELRTLAQVLIDLYGQSKMAELINSGVDLHQWFASEIAGRTATKKERQCAKACNFGFPGGLGIKRFVEYAKKSYGVDLTEESAKELKEKWLSAFPEMREYLSDRIKNRYDFSSLGSWCDSDAAFGFFKRIISGQSKVDGSPYSDKMRRWAFNVVLPELAPHLAGETEASPVFLRKVLAETVVTKSGRMRSNCSYSQARNTPFQALAADGCKIALYDLIHAGYRVVNFIHDEFIIEIPLSANLDEVGESVKTVVISAMQSLVPDVKIDAEFVFTDRWHKDAELVRDDNGHIRIFKEDDLKNNKTTTEATISISKVVAC